MAANRKSQISPPHEKDHKKGTSGKKKLSSKTAASKALKPLPKTKEPKKEFELLEHTADAKFIAFGKTFGEALGNCVKATISVMTDATKIRKKKKRTIELESKSRESLVYDFLDEIIFLIDTEGFLIKEVENIKIIEKHGGCSLKAVLVGDNARNYDVHTCIKAVTYNDMEIIQSSKGCIVQVVLDI